VNEIPTDARIAWDPLFGWAGFDPAGRVIVLGGTLTVEGPLRVGDLLSAALRDPAPIDAFLESCASAGLGTGSLPPARRLRAVWRENGRPRRRDTPLPAVDLVLRARRSRSGVVRVAAEFWQLPVDDLPSVPGALHAPGPLPLAPQSVGIGPGAAADLWMLGTALYAATVAPAAIRPVGLARLVLHPVALPRIRAAEDLDVWMAVALERLAHSANALGIQAAVARTGARELTLWQRDGTSCEALCEHWLAAMMAAPLVGHHRRLIVGPGAAWCVLPDDGQVLGYLLDALDRAYEPSGGRPSMQAKHARSLDRERDIDERRGALTGTLVELARSGRARLSAEPVIDAPTGLVAALHLKAEFRSLFAVGNLIDYLPDVVEDRPAADALNRWTAEAVSAVARPATADGPFELHLRVAPAQLQRIDSLGEVIRALHSLSGGAAPCLLLPEAAVHRNAYLLIDAAAEVAALGATLGIDDYRGLLPPAQLAQAGAATLRLHRSLVRDLAEHRFAQDRLADLLSLARRSRMSVVVAALADTRQLMAAHGAGALCLAGPLFGRATHLDSALPYGRPRPSASAPSGSDLPA